MKPAAFVRSCKRNSDNFMLVSELNIVHVRSVCGVYVCMCV